MKTVTLKIIPYSASLRNMVWSRVPEIGKWNSGAGDAHGSGIGSGNDRTSESPFSS